MVIDTQIKTEKRTHIQHTTFIDSIHGMHGVLHEEKYKTDITVTRIHTINKKGHLVRNVTCDPIF